MNTVPFPRTPPHLQKEEVQLLLRGGQPLEGTIHIPDGMPLLNFLGLRRFFLNLTSVREVGSEEEKDPVAHLSVRLSNVVWVIPMERSLHLSTALIPAEVGRTVELQLVDGTTLKVMLNISDEQRMSDYLDANSGFVPLFEARDLSTSRVIPRLAVNHEAILAIREVPRD